MEESFMEENGENYDPTLDLSTYVLPPVDLLKEYGGNGVASVSKEELESNKDKIVETLAHYKIDIAKIKATVGPTVTLYEIIPAPGVRIAKIKNLEDDIALSLSALGIRIIAPIPGKGTIGIEVPNSKPEMVSMKSLIVSEKFQSFDGELPIVIGKTITNETYVFDLTKMPHLLVAGATGQGKSVGLNAILVSLLYKKHPAQVKFVLVDPKKVELTLYNKIERHFLAKLPGEEDAIIVDTSKVVNTLNSLCIEMDDRYGLLKNAGVRTIKEYNAKFISRRLNPEKGHRYLPYIVVLIDEFADLIMTAGKEVEHPIARIAQLARAIGIHLIVATQRPSVNVITGMIKANFPARIAFRVLSKIDSRTILDSSGADQLIGRGDMLISTGSDMIRLQCGFVDTPEVEEICQFVGDQRAYPSAFLLPEYVPEGGESSKEFEMDEIDPMFVESARIVVTNQQGSASLLQRKLKLGYNRAGRIVDQLEAMGIIGTFQGSKARDVLFTDLESLDEFLRTKGLL
jgi:S-DNA-T family DNA segregation ATPase FtsK/SpoIIIE